MNNLDKFKSFVKNNPILVEHVNNNSMTWQKFYEIYDLYGEDNEVWNEYLNKKKTNNINNTSKNKISDILDMAKNIDTDKLQNGITSIQKAIGLVGDMLIKDKPDSNTYTPRPIYRKFDD